MKITNKETNRSDKDANGLTWFVNVRPDKVNGGWNVFVRFRGENSADPKTFHQPIHVNDRTEVRGAVAELLRWVNKMGFDSPMAEASRDRNFCNNKRRTSP